MIVHTLHREEMQNLGKVSSVQNQSIEPGLKLCFNILYRFHQHQNRIGSVRIRHRSDEITTQSSHSVHTAGWQAKMDSIKFWIPRRYAHKPLLLWLKLFNENKKKKKKPGTLHIECIEKKQNKKKSNDSEVEVTGERAKFIQATLTEYNNIMLFDWWRACLPQSVFEQNSVVRLHDQTVRDKGGSLVHCLKKNPIRVFSGKNDAQATSLFFNESNKQTFEVVCYVFNWRRALSPENIFVPNSFVRLLVEEGGRLCIVCTKKKFGYVYQPPASSENPKNKSFTHTERKKKEKEKKSNRSGREITPGL